MAVEAMPYNRLVWQPLVALSPLSIPLMVALRWLALKLVSGKKPSDRAVRFFYQIHAMEYWRGVWEGGAQCPIPRQAGVLAYHAIQDLSGAPVVESYGVPPDAFRRQLDMLKKAGYHFVSPVEVLQFLRRGGGLPPKPVLVTFDDGYQDLQDVVLPILKVALNVRDTSGGICGQRAVAGGDANEWDHATGAPQLRLLDADGLREVGAAGVMIGAHSGRGANRPLTQVSDAGLSDEIDGSITELQSAGLPRPTMFAYPYGEYDERVKAQTKSAGVEAAFTVVAGVVRPGQNPFEVPRIEIMRRDTGWKFLWKVWRAGRWTRKYCVQ